LQRYDQDRLLQAPFRWTFLREQEQAEAEEIYVKKENESATKMAKAIATLRKSGLKVTDETQKGGSIGITGVHDRREGCTELGKPTKYAQAIAKMLGFG
jgi:hypothetical protein